MLDVLLVVTMSLVCGGIGLPLAELLPARFAGRALVAPTLGLAVLSVAAPVAYRGGISAKTLLHTSVAVAALGLAWSGRRLAARGLASGGLRFALAATLCALGVMLVLLVPRWIGGDQFSVFQGNMWDTFSYLDSAVVYARRTYAVVSRAGDADLLNNPLWAIPQAQLGERPSIHLLYAAFSRIAPHEAYRLHYAFLVGCLGQFMPVAVFVLRAVLPKAAPAAWLAAAAVFPLGFWGQYVFDIGAWSQLASSPLLFLLAGLILHATISPAPRGEDVRIAVVLAVVVAGAVYLYPEGFLVYTAALGPFALAVPIGRMVRARQFAVRPLVLITAIAGVAAISLYPPVIDFLVKQVKLGSGTRVSWWTYFQAFFNGRDGVPGQPSDFLAGFFGLYFATPDAEACGALAVILRVGIVTVIVAVMLALVLVRERQLGRASRSMLIGWLVIAGLLVAPAAVFVYLENYWPAGKIVSYAAPVYMTLLATPIGFRFAPRALRPLRWFAIAFVAFQLGLGIVRIAAANAPDGIHYSAPYPSVTLPRFKQELGWDLTGLDAYLNRSQRVLLEPMDPWAEHYLMMFLYMRGIVFAKTGTVNTYFGAGRDLGAMPPFWDPDVAIFVERTGFLLQFRDRRPDVWVRSRPD